LTELVPPQSRAEPARRSSATVAHATDRIAAPFDPPAAAALATHGAQLNASPTVAGLRAQAARLNAGATVTLQRRLADTLAQRTPPENRTGLPDRLKSGLEAESGLGMDDVRVHYNSSQPAQLGAHAFAQGADIHVAPGQERHLAHEAWHVAQQKQGRVRPTMQLKGAAVNDEAALEHEADVMGARLVAGGASSVPQAPPTPQAPRRSDTVQAYFIMAGRAFVYDEASVAKINAEMDRRGKDSFIQNNRAAILKQIEDWATSEEAATNAVSYRVLVERARLAVGATLLAQQPAEQQEPDGLMPLDEDVVSDDDTEPDTDSELEELAGLRRTASFSLNDMSTFRDTSKTARFTASDSGSSYSITPHGNFMTGGGIGSGLPDDYQLIIAQLKAIYTTDQKVAQVLLAALHGTLPKPPALGLADKFRNLILGPELRRAGINPVAAEAALLRVSDHGGDLFAELRAGVLFVASEKEPQLGTGQGGSGRSRFHNNDKIDRKKPDFRSTAKRENRNIKRAARRFGKRDDVDGYVKLRTRKFAATWRKTYAGKSEGAEGAPVEDADEMVDTLPTIDEVGEEEEGSPDTEMVREETAPSGNCLYEGVNIALGNPGDMDGVLRQFATDWLLHHPQIATDGGIDADRVIAMLSRNGAWAGDAGDLAPYILASAIGRTIIVHTAEVTYHIEPEGGARGDDVELYLSGAHYTVNPPPGVDFASSIRHISGPGA
jgi:hypothetical protein